MANPDAHLTGGIMALIVMSIVFDDDVDGAPPPLSGEDPDETREENRERARRS